MEVIVKFTQEGAEELKKSVVGATDEVKELGNALALSKQRLAELPQGSKEFKKLEAEIKATETVMGNFANQTSSAKGQMRALQNEMSTLRFAMEKLKLEGKENTDAYRNLEKRFNSIKGEAALLLDTISDVTEEIKRAASDTNRLDVALRTIQFGVSIFGGLQGAAALFGSENKKLEETLEKVNGVMLIAQSLQQIQAELLKEDSIFTLGAAKAKDLYALAVGRGTTAMKIFRATLVSLGVGAALVGLGLAIGYISDNWDRLSSAFKEFYQKTAVRLVNAWIAVRNKFTQNDKPFVTAETLFPPAKEVEEKAEKTGQKVATSYSKGFKEKIQADTSSMLDIMQKQLQTLEKELEIAVSFGVSDKTFVNQLVDEINVLRAKIAEVQTEIDQLLNPQEIIFTYEFTVSDANDAKGGIREQIKKLSRNARDIIEEEKPTAKIGMLAFFGIDEDDEWNEKALAVFSKYAEIQKKFTDIIISGAQAREEAALFAARDRFQKGITSEKQFLREQAKIQNDYAKKKRKAEIADASAQVPIAALNTFTQTPGGIIIKTLAAAAATAFALAKVIQLKKAPLAKFKDGGRIIGKSHAQGGTIIEAEGDEYVINKRSVRKYNGYRNLNPIEAINKGVFEHYFQPKIVNKNHVDIGGVVTELKFVGEYIKQGNIERRQQGERLSKYFGSAVRT